MLHQSHRSWYAKHKLAAPGFKRFFGFPASYIQGAKRHDSARFGGPIAIDQYPIGQIMLTRYKIVCQIH
jgi:hypothetical protein